ncbi:hypothetical protein C9I56_21000 [Paraburkholderia caribensis]|uniref:Uncharacterized protein n=1 Tax=Paraburkholderia caribensis TaxID=75105 RepID=A0A9Q6WNW0_9BURK|nr:hypothetical protein C9I56_21000 [Paraburkholderia caribensis]QLB65239.1 hypothetical protein A9O66_22890 [Paraburkholderia caribensis]
MPVIAVVHCVHAAAAARRARSTSRRVRPSPRQMGSALFVPTVSGSRFAAAGETAARDRASGDSSSRAQRR